MLLSPSEIQQLTGYSRGSAQIRWLRRHGWKFTVNALGQPMVAIGEFNRHMVGGKAASVQEPNWGAMNGAHKAIG
jgi:hypothetical protein